MCGDKSTILSRIILIVVRFVNVTVEKRHISTIYFYFCVLVFTFSQIFYTNKALQNLKSPK